MKRFCCTAMLVLFLLTACGTAATPAPTVDVAATVSSLSGTMVAGTLTAQPTATFNPTATMTVTETETVTPTPAPPTETPVIPTETLTPTPFFGTLSPLDTSGDPQGYFLIENNTGQPEIIVNIYGSTYLGNPKPVYIAYKVTKSFLFQIPWGDYQYTVQVGTKKIFTGSVGIRNKDKTTMRVTMTKVVVVGP